jgi:hypothetical protein
MANQCGWEMANPVDFTAEWDGTTLLEGVRILGKLDAEVPVRSHFGHGILTWTIPYLFKTSPGYNLLMRGPANRPKDGVAALEGVVETDWCPATFTVNWVFTRPGVVEFARGEAIAMLVPCRRGELETIEPRLTSLDQADMTLQEYRAWRCSREAFLQELPNVDPANRRDQWQGDYFRGALGEPPPGTGRLQIRMHLRTFEKGEPGVRGECDSSG